MGLRKHRGSGGGGGATSVNLQTVILGAITIVLSLIMLGIAIDTISPYLTGGSSALNQYIDRNLDQRMQRTSRRPLPSGRMTEAEGLSLGIAECILSFFIFAGFVNLLAAILALTGMVYYVLVYSIWLKHQTVQNIVIGGGAGAIPPLVGWAAATG